MADRVCIPAFDVTNPRAIAFARQQGSMLIREIDAGTRAAVRQIIGDALEQGIPPRRAARAIRDQIGLTARQAKAVSNYRARLQASGLSAAKVDARVSRYAEKVRRRRALTIARTETMRAANAGAKELWHQARDAGTLPNDVKRVWIATPDERVRPEHLAAHGQVVGLGEPFSVADGATEPGSVPNCRCTHGIATPEDIEAWAEKSVAPAAPEGATWNGDLGGEAESSRALLFNEIRDQKSSAKENIVNDITERMRRNMGFGATAPEDARHLVAQLVNKWAGTSADSDAVSVAIQLRANEIWELAARIEHINGDALSRARTLLAEYKVNDLGEFFGRYKQEIADSPLSAVIDGFLRAQYELTQEYFESRGVKQVLLLRGARYESAVESGFGIAQLQPLSSFSVSPDTAAAFGDTYHLSAVAVADILSTPFTGVGCLSEYEFVVLGGDRAARTYAMDEIRASFDRLSPAERAATGLRYSSSTGKLLAALLDGRLK